jgi:hypothetical protein
MGSNVASARPDFARADENRLLATHGSGEQPFGQTTEPWWQRVLAGERLPKRLSRHPKSSCGVMGQRMRLECPLCGCRVCTLYHTISTAESLVVVVMAFGMRDSAAAAMAERRWPNVKFVAGLATTANYGPPSTHQSRAACGGGRTLVIVRRWNVSSARNSSNSRASLERPLILQQR